MKAESDSQPVGPVGSLLIALQVHGYTVCGLIVLAWLMAPVHLKSYYFNSVYLRCA